MITTTRINHLQNKIKEAISQICKEENVEITFGNCSYNNAFYKTQMTVKSLDKNERVDSALSALSKSIGFTQNVIGMKFVSPQLGSCEIVDIKTRNRKYPVICSSSNGKSYKLSVAKTKDYLGGDKIINRNSNLDKLV